MRMLAVANPTATRPMYAEISSTDTRARLQRFVPRGCAEVNVKTREWGRGFPRWMRTLGNGKDLPAIGDSIASVPQGLKPQFIEGLLSELKAACGGQAPTP